jgi:hypothetical protein
LDALYEWGHDAMLCRGLPIDPLDEMWHGYRERNDKMMMSPFKEF